jgi:hypothetical protein
VVVLGSHRSHQLGAPEERKRGGGEGTHGDKCC